MNKVMMEQAKEIATNVAVDTGNKKVGFIPAIIPIVLALIPFLIDMYKRCTADNPVPSTPQEMLQHRYDEDDQEYDRRLLRVMIEKTRDEAKDQGIKITKKEAKSTVIRTLDQSRLAENKVVGACMKV